MILNKYIVRLYEMAESSKTGHAIKQRKSPRDVFITPRELARLHIDYSLGNHIGDILEENKLIIDPCRYSEDGSYYSQLKARNINTEWMERTEGRDFLELWKGVYKDDEDNVKFSSDDAGVWMMEQPFAVIGNPPYSIYDEWIEATVRIKPQIISYLIGQGKLTAARIEYMNNNGYQLTKTKMLKVFKWYGMSYIVHFDYVGDSPKNNCIEIEDSRKVWR